MRFATLSHNIMYALHLEALLPRYARYARKAQRFGGLALFCVQENVKVAGGDAAGRIADALSRSSQTAWAAARCGPDPRMATLYDAGRWTVVDEAAIPLPALADLTPFEQLYIENATPEVKHAQATVLAPTRERAAPLCVLNVHLDAAGDNDHRARQLEIAVDGAPADTRLLVAGDTNCFALDRAASEAALAAMLAPLAERGVADAHASEPADTHFFARTTESGAGHRIARALGFLGLDAPRRYDVLASDAERVASGYVVTPESDHDAPWAAFSLPLA